MAGTSQSSPGHDPSQWIDPEPEPALLSPEQMTLFAHSNTDAARSVAGIAGPEHASTQARLDCLTDALQPGLPPADRGGWRTDLLAESLYSTGTFGDRDVVFNLHHAEHPAGLRAVAFILAHEMAHNVADHPNRQATHRFVSQHGVEKTSRILDRLSPRFLERSILESPRPADADARSRLREAEADRGALHILHHAGVPLDGARAWAEATIDDPATFNSGTHPEGHERRRAIDSLADRLDDRPSLGLSDPSAECEPAGLAKRGWLSRAWEKLSGLLPAPPPLPASAPVSASDAGNQGVSPVSAPDLALTAAATALRERRPPTGAEHAKVQANVQDTVSAPGFVAAGPLSRCGVAAGCDRSVACSAPCARARSAFARRSFRRKPCALARRSARRWGCPWRAREGRGPRRAPWERYRVCPWRRSAA